MAAPLRLSVLDQSPIAEGVSPGEALRNTVDVARAADTLGYHRYWVAEHHGSTTVACAAPEVLVAAIGSATNRIRIGSGGVLLTHYSAVKVAEVFTVLSGLFPGRVDLGIGRATGAFAHTTFALQRDRRPRLEDDFTEQLRELIDIVGCRVPQRLSPAALAGFTGCEHRPDIWLLGSSKNSAELAAKSDLPYAYADFIRANGESATAVYRETMERSKRSPRLIVAVSVLCADTDEEAEYISRSSRVFAHLRPDSSPTRLPSPETATRLIAEHPTPLETNQVAAHTIVGSPQTVRELIEASARQYGADEMMILTEAFEHAARVRSYELIAGEFRLSPFRG